MRDAMAKIKIYREQGGKPVGTYDTETHTYYKTVKGKLHIYNSPPSICNDLTICQELNRLGCYYLHIYNTANRKHYWTTMKLIWDKGFAIPNYGYGSQRALELRYWYPEAPPLQEEFATE